MPKATLNQGILDSRVLNQVQDLNHEAIEPQCSLYEIEVKEVEEHPLACKKLESREHACPVLTSLLAGLLGHNGCTVISGWVNE